MNRIKALDNEVKKAVTEREIHHMNELGYFENRTYGRKEKFEEREKRALKS